MTGNHAYAGPTTQSRVSGDVQCLLEEVGLFEVLGFSNGLGLVTTSMANRSLALSRRHCYLYRLGTLSFTILMLKVLMLLERVIIFSLPQLLGSIADALEGHHDTQSESDFIALCRLVCWLLLFFMGEIIGDLRATLYKWVSQVRFMAALFDW